MNLKATILAMFVVAALSCTAVPVSASSLSVELMDALHEQGVISDASYDELKKTAASGDEDAVSRELVELLHNNGTINDSSYQRLSEAAKRPVPQSSPAVTSAPDPAPTGDRPAGAAMSEVEEGFARLGGDIKLKIGAWVQGGFVYDDLGSNSGALPGSSAVTDSGNSFHFRHARPYLNFAFRDKTGFRIMMDAADTSGKPLRDVFVWFDYIPYTRVTFGQFLTPFGSESWRAPFENPMINYSYATTLMQLTNFRDTGLMIAPTYKTEVAGMPLKVGLATALIQGNGINGSDENGHKDVIGRAWVEPFVPGLQVGGSWYIGKNRVGNINPDWQRWGAEINYSPELVPGLALRGEYLFQSKYYAATAPATYPNRYVHSSGWYAQASYRLSGFDGGLGFLNNVQPAVRYEEMDEDMAVADNGRSKLTLGVNYWFNKYLRLLADYEIIDADSALATNTIMPKGIDAVDHNMLTTHLQLWF